MLFIDMNAMIKCAAASGVAGSCVALAVTLKVGLFYFLVNSFESLPVPFILFSLNFT